MKLIETMKQPIVGSILIVLSFIGVFCMVLYQADRVAELQTDNQILVAQYESLWFMYQQSNESVKQSFHHIVQCESTAAGMFGDMLNENLVLKQENDKLKANLKRQRKEKDVYFPPLLQGKWNGFSYDVPVDDIPTAITPGLYEIEISSNPTDGAALERAIDDLINATPK